MNVLTKNETIEATPPKPPQTPDRETVDCPLCGAAETEPVYRKQDRYGSGEWFEVVRCTACGLMRVNPRPPGEAIARYYQDTYSWKADQPVAGLLPRMIRAAEHWYRFHLLGYEAGKVMRFCRLKPGAEILDVGCGSGDRLLVYRQLGLEPYGVEISSAAEYARDHLSLAVRCGNLAQAAYDDEQFDVVTLYNVLEHLHAPKAELQEIHRILRPGGCLVVEVPSADCLQRKIFGPRWSALDVPRDLAYWTPELLRRMMAEGRFEVEKIDQWTSWLHPPMIVLTLCPGLDPRLVWAGVASGGGQGIIKRGLWAGLTLAMPWFTFMESLLGRGSSMVFYARKQ